MNIVQNRRRYCYKHLFGTTGSHWNVLWQSLQFDISAKRWEETTSALHPIRWLAIGKAGDNRSWKIWIHSCSATRQGGKRKVKLRRGAMRQKLSVGGHWPREGKFCLPNSFWAKRWRRRITTLYIRFVNIPERYSRKD